MEKIKELNNTLSHRLKQEMEDSKKTLINLDSKYPEINIVKQKILDFDMEEFENNIFNLLENKLIIEWVKYQSKEDVEQYDMIYFEYHEQSHEYSEALSYGIFDMKEYQLTIDSHDFGYDYKFSYWEAGLGIDLEPFKLTEPIGYSNLNDDDYFDLISYKDSNSGYDQIWNTINTICRYALHRSFKKTDVLGLFEPLKIKKGGLFSYDMHDNGMILIPFYIKG
ncbi:MAG: hypothetical protein AB8F94_01130 [Saprospiraceae bacterium]